MVALTIATIPTAAPPSMDPTQAMEFPHQSQTIFRTLLRFLILYFCPFILISFLFYVFLAALSPAVPTAATATATLLVSHPLQ